MCMLGILWLVKCDYMSLLRNVFGKRAHVLIKVVTERSRVMTVVATVFIYIKEPAIITTTITKIRIKIK